MLSSPSWPAVKVNGSVQVQVHVHVDVEVKVKVEVNVNVVRATRERLMRIGWVDHPL